MGLLDFLTKRVDKGQKIKVNPYDQFINIFSSTGHEKEVRNHLLVSSCAYITGKQSGKLAITINPIEGYEDKATQQITEWQRFLDTEEPELFEQMWSYAWAYNVSFADPCVNTLGRYTVSDFVVIPQTTVTANINGYSYYGQNIDENRVLKMQFRPESELSLANQLWPYVSSLQSLQRADTLAGVINSVGEKNLRWKPNNPAKNYNQKDFDAAIAYINGAGEAEFSITCLPDWHIEVTQPPAEPDFEGKIKRNRQEILTSFQMNWLDASSWTSGTYGSIKAQMETYNDFILSIRKAWVKSLESMARRVASWNLEPLYIKFDCEKPTLDESTLDRMAAINTLKQLNLTPEEQSILYPEVGLPVPEIQETVVEPVKVAAAVKQSSLDYLNSKYAGALQGFMIEYNKALQQRPYNYKLGGWETLAQSLKVDPAICSNARDKYNGLFQSLIKMLKSNRHNENVAKIEFNRIWKSLATEVQSWL